jgi:hypothetical protein
MRLFVSARSKVQVASSETRLELAKLDLDLERGLIYTPDRVEPATGNLEGYFLADRHDAPLRTPNLKQGPTAHFISQWKQSVPRE